jgi:DNA-3-methyladenine glycosylase
LRVFPDVLSDAKIEKLFSPILLPLKKWVAYYCGNNIKMRLNRDFFLQDDVVSIARNLLGKEIFTSFDRTLTSGIISETEAYAGIHDRASHAYGNRRTRRTETLYLEGGRAYVYLCYGIHHLFNFVTNVEGIPHAVLLRGIIPRSGCSIMEQRRGKRCADQHFSDGPGKVSMALGIHTGHDGLDLAQDEIWVEETAIEVDKNNVLMGPRIGVDYAKEDALLPYRFLLKNQSSLQ